MGSSAPAVSIAGRQRESRQPADPTGGQAGRSRREILDGEWRTPDRIASSSSTAATRPAIVMDRCRWPTACRPDEGWSRLGLACRNGPCGGNLFIDLETTGLAGGAGSYAFLVGCGWFDGALSRPAVPAVELRVRARVARSGQRGRRRRSTRSSPTTASRSIFRSSRRATPEPVDDAVCGHAARRHAPSRQAPVAWPR